MKKVIDWFEIAVSELPRAQAFYEAVLQTSLQREDYAGPEEQLAVFPGECEMVRGALIAGAKGLRPGAGGTLIYFNAGSCLDSALERVKAAGGQVVMGNTALPQGLGFMAHVRDLDGNLIGLHTCPSA